MDIDFSEITEKAFSFFRSFACARICTPAEYLSRDGDAFFKMGEEQRKTIYIFCGCEMRKRYRFGTMPPREELAAVNIMLSALPPVWTKASGSIMLYRGMSIEEARQIASGQYDCISYYWTPIKNKAAGYAFHPGEGRPGVVCLAFVPVWCVKYWSEELNEVHISPAQALPLAARIDFYKPISLSRIINKNRFPLTINKLFRKIFGEYGSYLYLRVAKHKLLRK